MNDTQWLARRLRAEMAALAPDNWEDLKRRVSAAGRVAKLMDLLDGPPLGTGRLYWELKMRLEAQLLKEAV